MLLSFIPSSDINFSIVELILALALELIIAELAYIFDSIWPRQFSEALHLAIFPLALVALTISPVVSACSFNHSLLKLTTITRAIS